MANGQSDDIPGYKQEPNDISDHTLVAWQKHKWDQEDIYKLKQTESKVWKARLG